MEEDNIDIHPLSNGEEKGQPAEDEQWTCYWDEEVGGMRMPNEGKSCPEPAMKNIPGDNGFIKSFWEDGTEWQSNTPNLELKYLKHIESPESKPKKRAIPRKRPASFVVEADDERPQSIKKKPASYAPDDGGSSDDDDKPVPKKDRGKDIAYEKHKAYSNEWHRVKNAHKKAGYTDKESRDYAKECARKVRAAYGS